MSTGFVPKSHTATRAPAPSPRRRGKLIFVFFVIVVLGVGYVTFKDKIPGLRPEPTSALPATFFTEYEKFWNENPEGVPPELSIDRATALANECVYEGMAPNTPQYLDADGIGRAQGGYVCLLGTQVEATDTRCPALGTNKWRRAQQPPL